MKKNEIIDLINILNKTYPDAKCSLDFETPFELLVAVILSAQCTDDRVNKVTPILFKVCSKHLINLKELQLIPMQKDYQIE